MSCSIRNAARQPAAHRVPKQLEHSNLWRVLASQHVFGPGLAAFDRPQVPVRDIVDERVGPDPLRADHSGQFACEVIRKQAPDEVAFRQSSGSVDDTGIDAYERRSIGDSLAGHRIRREFRTLVVVPVARAAAVTWRHRQKRRRVDNSPDVGARGRGNHVSQPAHVHIIEVLPAATPDGHERCGVADGIAALRRGVDRRRVTDVSIDELCGQPARTGRPGERDHVVPTRGGRRDQRAAQVTRAAGDQQPHGADASTLVRQSFSRSSSVCSNGISGLHPSSSRNRRPSPRTSGVSFGR